MAPRFTLLDHPSDVGIIVHGRDQQELFANAAFGLFALITDPATVRPQVPVAVSVGSKDLGELMVNWLNELIYLEDARKMLFSEFRITKLTGQQLEAIALGEPIDLARHPLNRAVKAATYNQLQVGPKEAKIVFDV